MHSVELHLWGAISKSVQPKQGTLLWENPRQVFQNIREPLLSVGSTFLYSLPLYCHHSASTFKGKHWEMQADLCPSGILLFFFPLKISKALNSLAEVVHNILKLGPNYSSQITTPQNMQLKQIILTSCCWPFPLMYLNHSLMSAFWFLKNYLLINYTWFWNTELHIIRCCQLLL